MEVLLPEDNENMSDRDEAKREAQKLHKGGFILHGVTKAAHQCGAKPVKMVDVEGREMY